MTHDYPTLVLAGKRSAADPVAQHGGVAFKAIAPVAGRPMIAHVLDALATSRMAGPVYISVEEPAAIRDHDALRGFGNIHTVQASTSSICRSIQKMVAEGGLKPPFLVTTADHALLTPGMIDHFWGAARGLDADFAVAIVTESLFRQSYPDARRTFIGCRGDSFKSCNMFGFLTPDSLKVLDFWAAIEQQRKQPLKLARAFGIGNLLRYVLRLDDIDGLIARAGRILGVRAAAIRMTEAEAAIDVDSVADLRQVESLMAARRSKEAAA